MTASATDADDRADRNLDDGLSIAVEELDERAIVRLPRADGPAWEADLVRGFEAGRVASLDRLRDVVPELEQVLSAEWGTAAFPVGLSRHAIGALALPELFDELVVAHELRPERLQATNGAILVGGESGFGTFVPGFDLSKSSPAQVAANVAAGGGATIFGVDDHSPALARWMEDWDRVVGLTCRADLSLLGGGFGAVAPADDSCRLVVPADHAARVRVWQSDGDATAPAGSPGASSPHESVARETLAVQPGTALCVPPGCGIELGWADEPAVVLTLVVPRLTTGRLLALVQGDATYWPMLRADVPWDLDAPVRSWGGSVHDPGRSLTASMTDVVDAVPMGRVLARLRAALAPRAAALFSATAVGGLGGPLRVRCPVAGFGVYEDASLPTPEGSVALACGGRRVVMAEAMAEVLGRAADGAPLELESLLEQTDDVQPEQVVQIVDGLLEVGLLEVAS